MLSLTSLNCSLMSQRLFRASSFSLRFVRAIRLLFLGVQPAEFITDAASVSVARLNIETLDTITFMNILYCLNGSLLRKPPFNKKLDS